MTTAYKYTALTGGAANALDSVDGDSLVDGDFAFVNTGSENYIYELDADSGEAESSPDIIAPDTNAGDKRWILQAYRDATSSVKGIARLATNNEALSGESTVVVITPANLTAKIALDPALSGESDLLVPSQKAVKAYVDANAGTSVQVSNDATLSGESTINAVSEAAVKGYVASEGGGFVPYGYYTGLVLARKDNDEIYVSAGSIEMGGVVYEMASAGIISATCSGTQTYYVYVDPPDSGTALGSSDFSISTTAPSFDLTKGGYYHPTATDQRSFASFGSSSGAVPAGVIFFTMPPMQIGLDTDETLAADSTGRLPSQSAVKGYVDTIATGILEDRPLHYAHLSGLVVSKKDNDEIYVSGGSIEIDGVIYNANAAMTGDASGLDPLTLYYVYINPPEFNPLQDANIAISTDPPAWANAYGYWWDTSTQQMRAIAYFQTDSDGHVPSNFVQFPAESMNVESQVVHSSPRTDQTVTGPTSYHGAGEDLAFGDTCYQKPDGTWYKATAHSGEMTLPAFLMAVETITSGEAGKFAEPGAYVRDDSWDWTPGKTLFVSTSLSGELLDAPPSGESGALAQIFARSEASNIIQILASPVIIEIE